MYVCSYVIEKFSQHEDAQGSARGGRRGGGEEKEAWQRVGGGGGNLWLLYGVQ